MARRLPGLGATGERPLAAPSPVSEAATHGVPDAAGAPTTPPWVPFLLGGYLLACGALAIYMTVDAWVGQFSLLELLLPDGAFLPERLPTVQTAAYTAMGAVLGASILSLYGLHLHGAIYRSFQRSYIGSYLIGPWSAALLAIAIYAMLRAGLLVVAGTPASGGSNIGSHFIYLALGCLIGFSWDKVLQRMSTVAENLFSGRSKPEGNPEVGGSTASEPPASVPVGDRQGKGAPMNAVTRQEPSGHLKPVEGD